MNEEKLKKGCGKRYGYKYKNGELEDVFTCGETIYHLCPICQAKLLQRQEDVKEFEKKIKKLLMYSSYDLKNDGILWIKYSDLNKLVKRYEKEIVNMGSLF